MTDGTVVLPVERPTLTPQAARLLLKILKDDESRGTIPGSPSCSFPSSTGAISEGPSDGTCR